MSNEESRILMQKCTRRPEDQQTESPERPAKLARFGSEIVEEEEGEERKECLPISMNPHGLQRYLVAVEYIGTRFAGAQKQPSARTVVGVLEDAFHKFIGQPVSIFCSSRTDAGVHALSNVCHVDVVRISKRKPGEVLAPHDSSVVKRAVNHFLQKNEGDIVLVDVRSVPNDFHARYKAAERMYYYRLISGGDCLSTFDMDRAWHVPQELDLSAMKKACQVLAGRHDFSSFRSAACQANSPIRTLDELSITEIASNPFASNPFEAISVIDNSSKPGIDKSSVQHNQVFGTRKRQRSFMITARARSFLYHQVRLLVGVLKAVGTGNLTVSDVQRILEAKDVAAASPMAPACGLYLAHVKYDLSSVG